MASRHSMPKSLPKSDLYLQHKLPHAPTCAPFKRCPSRCTPEERCHENLGIYRVKTWVNPTSSHRGGSISQVAMIDSLARGTLHSKNDSKASKIHEFRVMLHSPFFDSKSLYIIHVVQNDTTGDHDLHQ